MSFSRSSPRVAGGCQINKTGGTTTYSNASAYGITVSDGSVTIKNNQISIVTPVGNGYSYGIDCFGSDHFVIGNQIDNCRIGVQMNSGAGKRQDNLTSNCSSAFSGGIDAGGNN